MNYNTIIYTSNGYSHLYPQNRSGEFTSFIDDSKLQYLLNKKSLSVAIKSFSLKLNANLQTSKKIFGIQSNLSSQHIIKSSKNSNLLTTFTIPKKREKQPRTGIITISFENPIFYPTNKELLQNAYFKIIDIDNDSLISSLYDWDTPTIVSCLIKNREENMKPGFNIICESNDPKSKSLYPTNNHMHFNVNLPRTFHIGNNNVGISLKSLHLTNKLFNVKNKTDYTIWIDYYEWNGTTDGGQKLVKQGHQTDIYKLFMEPGYYSTSTIFSQEINRIIGDNNIPISLEVNPTTKHFSFVWSKRNNSDDIRTMCRIRLSAKLATALGFKQNLTDELFYDINLNRDELTNKEISNNKKSAGFPPNIFLMTPTEVFIQCNLIESMVVGNVSMKTLGYVSLIGKLTNNIMSFELESNIFSTVLLESFDTIEISITDIDGNLIKYDTFGSTPTLVNLLFKYV